MGKVLVVGSLNYDLSVYTNKIPNIGETVIGEKFSFSCGGKGANQAYAAKKAGVYTYMIGRIGNDDYGQLLLDNLNKVSINTTGIKISEDVGTGISMLTIDQQGRNNIVVVPGANLKTTVYENPDFFETASVLLLQNEISSETNKDAIDHAKKNKMTIIYNPAPYYSIDEQIYKAIDFLTPNEHELSLLVPDKQDLEEKAMALIDRGVKNVIVTLGAKGALLVDENKHCIQIPAPKVKAIDTVGAGDCFNGYFAAMICQGKLPHEAIKFAIYAASMSIKKEGAQNSYPEIDEVNKFIKKEQIE